MPISKGFTVRLDQDMLKTLSELAVRQDRSVGQVIRRAVRLYLVEHGDNPGKPDKPHEQEQD